MASPPLGAASDVEEDPLVASQEGDSAGGAYRGRFTRGKVVAAACLSVAAAVLLAALAQLAPAPLQKLAPPSLAQLSAEAAAPTTAPCGALSAAGVITTNVDTFTSESVMQANGWKFSHVGECPTYHFRAPLHDPAGHQLSIPESSYYGWCWRGELVLSLQLKGSGSLFLTARNGNARGRYTKGDVGITVGQKSVAIGPGEESVEHWSFRDGDVLQLHEDGDGIIVVDHLTFTCGAPLAEAEQSAAILERAAKAAAAAAAICEDVQPPAAWTYNTCEKQRKELHNCARRREGTLNDGYCAKTCGVCTSASDAVPAWVKREEESASDGREGDDERLQSGRPWIKGKGLGIGRRPQLGKGKGQRHGTGKGKGRHGEGQGKNTPRPKELPSRRRSKDSDATQKEATLESKDNTPTREDDAGNKQKKKNNKLARAHGDDDADNEDDDSEGDDDEEDKKDESAADDEEPHEVSSKDKNSSTREDTDDGHDDD
eukprot:TRINITY_DN24538_c0_g1_i1.p1 TRINITY_DN24538_c0_g1~~TRINITY_DN24538_c0_g1_i1.p1  ORF type:complete len:501 (-),score=123.25 TRINITY_DN24538_c0_g1_i1:498-1958(-)